MNEDSEMTTFQSNRGPNNIYLTINNNKLLKKVQEWKISEEESCSDHKIIQFCTGQHNVRQTGHNFQCVKYIIREQNHNKFETLLTKEMAQCRLVKTKVLHMKQHCVLVERCRLATTKVLHMNQHCVLFERCRLVATKILHMNQHCVLVERCRLVATKVLHMNQHCVLVERCRLATT